MREKEDSSLVDEEGGFEWGADWRDRLETREVETQNGGTSWWGLVLVGVAVSFPLWFLCWNGPLLDIGYRCQRPGWEDYGEGEGRGGGVAELDFNRRELVKTRLLSTNGTGGLVRLGWLDWLGLGRRSAWRSGVVNKLLTMTVAVVFSMLNTLSNIVLLFTNTHVVPKCLGHSIAQHPFFPFYFISTPAPLLSLIVFHLVFRSVRHLHVLLLQALTRATANWSLWTLRLMTTTLPMRQRGSAKSTWWCDEGDHLKSSCCLDRGGTLMLRSSSWRFG